MAGDVVVFQKSDMFTEAFPVMEDIRRKGKLCDVTLKVEENRVSAHRIVLAATIPYFNAMFTHDMVEARQDEISMQGIQPSALQALVNYAYNGRIEISISTVQSLLVGASFLQLQAVKEACCDFMKNRLQSSNVLGVRSFADQYMCGSLVEACNKFINKHFSEVIATDEFVALDKEEVLNILSRDELHVTSEEQVFEAGMAWVKQDVSSRQSILPPLLKCVRLPLLTPQFLIDRVAQEELVKTSLICRDLLDEAKDYHLIPERRTLLQTFSIRPRCCTDLMGIIYAVGGLTPSGNSISTVECFDPIVGRWDMTEPMSTLRSRVGVAVMGGQLYAIGGYDGHQRLDTVEVFTPLARTWKLVAPMGCRRSALGAAALEGNLYVCGGYDGLTSLKTVERFDPQTNSWLSVSDMSRHRSAAGVTAFDGDVFALGGHDGLSIFNSVERYNANSDTWTTVSAMQSKRCRLGVTTLNGKLYVAGGYDGNVFLKTAERYDPRADSWEYIASMKVKRSRVSLVANCGKLYAIGGYDGVRNLNSVEIYDPETNQWTFGKEMGAHEGGVGAGVIPLDQQS